MQENIVCFVSFPTLVNQREQFRFTAEDMVKVKSYTWTNDFLMVDHVPTMLGGNYNFN